MADIEAHIKDFTKQQKTEYLRSLTAEQQLKYRRYKDNQRQKKYKQNPENRKKANELSRVRMEELRSGEPEKYKEMNREHNQTYNKKIRAIKTKAEALNKISDAIKAKKARQQAEIRAVEKATATAEKLTQKQQEIKQIMTRTRPKAEALKKRYEAKKNIQNNTTPTPTKKTRGRKAK